MNYRLPDPKFWLGKKVLITGHSGFKGGWLSIWLERLGAEVFGISLKPDTEPNLFSSANIDKITKSKFLDITDREKLISEVSSIAPQIVIHMAAQPLVRRSYSRPLETFDTNISGTINILESIRCTEGIECAILITTDKVYSNLENGKNYKEDDSLGGHDPYSASKAATEIIIESFRKSFFTKNNLPVSSARAGNVIGGGDWSEDRIIPDAIRAWGSGSTLDIRNPEAIRPWQHVLDSLSGYLVLAENTSASLDLAGAYNFGPNELDSLTVKHIIKMAQKFYTKGEVKFLKDYSGPHEANLLSLDTKKAKEKLAFQSRWDSIVSVEKTMNWYEKFERGMDARYLCLCDIEDYERNQ